MSFTKHRAIRKAVAALVAAAGTSLSAAPSPSLPSQLKGLVFENRNYALADGVVYQVHVNYTGSEPEQVAISGAPITWVTTIEIVIRARRERDTSAEDVADAVWAALYARLMANQSLGGLAAYMDPGSMSVQDDPSALDVCALTWTVGYRHDTANNTIT